MNSQKDYYNVVYCDDDRQSRQEDRSGSANPAFEAPPEKDGAAPIELKSHPLVTHCDSGVSESISLSSAEGTTSNVSLRRAVQRSGDSNSSSDCCQVTPLEDKRAAFKFASQPPALEELKETSVGGGSSDNFENFAFQQEDTL